MSVFLRSIIILFVFLLPLLKISAQVSTTASATATIVTPVGTEKWQDISFGKFSAGNKPEIIQLNSTGIKFIAGAVKTIKTDVVSTIASFNIIGGSVYDITIPSTNIILKRQGGRETITANVYNLSSITNNSPSGLEILSIGATLKVGASQVAGYYNSLTPFTITVNYN